MTRDAAESKCPGCGKFTKTDWEDKDMRNYWCDDCGREWDAPVAKAKGGE